jgi:hypothetical protein
MTWYKQLLEYVAKKEKYVREREWKNWIMQLVGIWKAKATERPKKKQRGDVRTKWKMMPRHGEAKCTL